MRKNNYQSFRLGGSLIKWYKINSWLAITFGLFAGVSLLLAGTNDPPSFICGVTCPDGSTATRACYYGKVCECDCNGAPKQAECSFCHDDPPQE